MSCDMKIAEIRGSIRAISTIRPAIRRIPICPPNANAMRGPVNGFAPALWSFWV